MDTVYLPPEQSQKDQWYDKFNARSEDANTIRVTRQHKVLLENVYQGKHSESVENSHEKKKNVRVDSEEQ